MFRRILVGDNERVLLVRKGRFEDILGPGEYWKGMLGREFERRNISEVVFSSEWAAHIVSDRPELTERYFAIVETTDAEVAVVYFDGKLVRVVAPGQRVMFWRGPVKITAEVFDVRTNPEAPRALLPGLARLGRESQATLATVDEGKRGLLYIDGKLVRELSAGAYGFWSAAGNPRVDAVETRLQTLEIPGQEILTRDKVTIRVNVWAVFEIADAVVARSTVKDVSEHLYRTLQIAVRQTLGKRTLEEVLAEKVDIDAAVSAEVRREMALYGVRVGEIALKDIVLPGDIREILNQVVAAEKQAQANLIRRREETAATRSLLNTAKLMEDNPLLIRLKELETLEKIAEKVEKIHVGDFDSLLERTVTLRRE